MKLKDVSAGEIRSLLARLKRENPDAHRLTVELLRVLMGDKKSTK